MKMMTTIKKEYITHTSLFISALLMLFLGLLLLFNFNFVEDFVLFWIMIISFIMGCWKIIEIILKKELTFLSEDIVPVLLYIGIAALIYFFPGILTSILPWVFLFSVGLEGVAKFASWYVNKKNGIGHRFKYLVSAIISLLFFVILLFNGAFRIDITYFLIGIYFTLQAILLFYTWYQTAFNQNVDRVKRRVRIALPVAFAGLLPKRVLKEINTSLETSENHMNLRTIKKDVPVTVEVFVHMSMLGAGVTGHVDICIDDIVISYGSYDASTHKLGSAIGDGVIFFSNKEQYIPFVTKRSSKTLIGFGIYLNDKEKLALRKRLDQVLSNTYEWHCLAESEGNEEVHDYASDLYRATGAHFKKFNSGPYKTYFVLNKNCVQLADNLLGSAGLDMINPSGIITPGAYLDYLEANYEIEGTSIVTRTIYKQEKE